MTLQEIKELYPSFIIHKAKDNEEDMIFLGWNKEINNEMHEQICFIVEVDHFLDDYKDIMEKVAKEKAAD